MGLSNKKEEQLRTMPILRCTVSKSKDGKYLLHRTTITHIKPVAYYDAILNGRLPVAVEDVGEELKEFA